MLFRDWQGSGDGARRKRGISLPAAGNATYGSTLPSVGRSGSTVGASALKATHLLRSRWGHGGIRASATPRAHKGLAPSPIAVAEAKPAAQDHYEEKHNEGSQTARPLPKREAPKEKRLSIQAPQRDRGPYRVYSSSTNAYNAEPTSDEAEMKGFLSPLTKPSLRTPVPPLTMSDAEASGGLIVRNARGSHEPTAPATTSLVAPTRRSSNWSIDSNGFDPGMSGMMISNFRKYSSASTAFSTRKPEAFATPRAPPQTAAAPSDSSPLSQEKEDTPPEPARPSSGLLRIAARAAEGGIRFLISRNIVGNIEDQVESSSSRATLHSRQNTPGNSSVGAPPRTTSSRAPRPVTSSTQASTSKDSDGSISPRGGVGRKLSPLLVMRKREAEAKAKKRREARLRKKEKVLEETREMEARERELMNQEEWLQERAKWHAGAREGSWKTVRVFISSTFNDMHGERDALTRNVFPALNQLTRSRRVRVLPVDLRWGLTAEDTSDTGLGALEHCLLEVDNTRPFFVVLNGERYGWIPPGYRVTDRPEFDWVRTFEPNHSITAMEIYHGFLRKAFTPVHAFVYQRDPSFVEEINNPDEKRIFVFDYEGNEEVLARRNKLRDDMRAHPYCTYRSYSCRYGGKDEEGKPVVTHLQSFENQLLQDLWTAIKFEFPPPPPPLSDLEMERLYHAHFVEERARSFIGRHGLMKTLFDHALSHVEDESYPLVVIGHPGSGKTSLVCSFASQFTEAQPRVFTLTHIVSASPSSTDIREVLMRLSRELVERFNVEWTLETDEYQMVKESFPNVLEAAGRAALEERSSILLIMDAVNQLNPFYNAHSMDWYPKTLPPGVTGIVSSTPDAKCLSALQKRDHPPPVISVPGLSKEEAREIVEKQLKEYRKKLTGPQMDMLLEKKEWDRPLFLLTCCEELRLQAQYGIGGSGVDTMIKYLPDVAPELLQVVLERVERDMGQWARTAGQMTLLLAQKFNVTSTNASEGFAESKLTGARAGASGDNQEVAVTEALAATVGRMLVREALTLLECSRHGLRETELLELLAPPGKSQLPPVVWARLHRCLELYLRPMGEDDTGMLGFFHMQMVFAVRRRYLASDPGAESTVNRLLASYFWDKADPSRDLAWVGNSRRGFHDIVYYQLRGLQVRNLRDTLGNLRFIEARARLGAGSMEHLLRDYHDAQEALRKIKYSVLKEQLSEAASSRSVQLQWVGEFNVFVGGHHANLIAHPNLTFQYAYNQPDTSQPRSAALAMLEAQTRRLRRGFYRQVKKNLALGLGDASLPIETASDASSGSSEEESLSALEIDIAEASSPASLAAMQGSPVKGFRRTSAGGASLASMNPASTAYSIHKRALMLLGDSPDAMKLLLKERVWKELRRRQGFGSRYRPGGMGKLQDLGLYESDALPRRFLAWVNKPRRNRILADFAGYASEVMSLCLHPEGTCFGLGFRDGSAQLVDADTGETVREMSVGGHSEAVTAMAFSPDGHRVATGSQDSDVIIWDAHTGNLLTKLTDHTLSITALTWLGAPASARNKGHQRSSTARSGVSRVLVTASIDCSLVVWEERRSSGFAGVSGGASSSSGSEEFRYEKTCSKDWLQAPILSLAYCSSTGTLVAGRGDGVVEVLDARALTLGLLEIAKFSSSRYGSSITAIALSPDGHYIATGSLDAAVKLWWTEDGTGKAWTEQEMQGSGHGGSVTNLEFSAGGSRLLSASLDKKLLLWDMESRGEVLSLAGHADKVYAARFLPGGDKVVSGSYDKTVKVWEVGEEENTRGSAPVKRANALASVRATAPRPTSSRAQSRGDGKGGSGGHRKQSVLKVISNFGGGDGGGGGGSKRIASRRGVRRKTTTEAPAVFAPYGAHGDRITAAVVRSDGEIAVTGSADRTVKVWNTVTGEEICVLVGHSTTVTAVALSLDGKLLVSGDEDGDLMLWDGATWDHLKTIEEAHASAITALHVADLQRFGIAMPSRNFANLVVYSGAADGSMFAWDPSTATKNPVQVEAGTLNSPITAIVAVPASASPSPATSRGSPLNSGYFPTRQQYLSKVRPRRGSQTSIPTVMSNSSNDNKSTARGAPSRGGQGTFRPSSRDRRRRGQSTRDTTLAAVGTDSVAPDSHGADDAAPWLIGEARHPADPRTSVPGLSPRYDCARVMALCTEGRFAVFDMHTMELLHSDSAQQSMKPLATGAISADGARVALAKATLGSALAAAVAPSAGLRRAVPASLKPVVDNHVALLRKNALKAAAAERSKPKPTPAKQGKDQGRPGDAASGDSDTDTEEQPTTAAGFGAARALIMSKQLANKMAAKAKSNRPKRSKGKSSNDVSRSRSRGSLREEEGDQAKARGATPAPKPVDELAESLKQEQDQDGHGNRRGSYSLVEKEEADISCTSLAFSCDGSLLVAGCTEKMMAVLDPARPDLGPLAQFIAYGDVTAVACGPGLTPWKWKVHEHSDMQEGAKQDRAAAAAAAAGHGEAGSGSSGAAAGLRPGLGGGAAAGKGSAGRDGSLLSKFTGSFSQSSSANEGEKESLESDFGGVRAGDGSGSIGVIVAGDVTGALFILRLMDVARIAESEAAKQEEEDIKSKQDESIQAEKARQKAEEALEEEKMRKKEEQTHIIPEINLEPVNFSPEVSVPSITLHRCLQPTNPTDISNAELALVKLGIDLAGMTGEKLQKEDEMLLAKFFLETYGLRVGYSADELSAVKPSGKWSGAGLDGDAMSVKSFPDSATASASSLGHSPSHVSDTLESAASSSSKDTDKPPPTTRSRGRGRQSVFGSSRGAKKRGGSSGRTGGGGGKKEGGGGGGGRSTSRDRPPLPPTGEKKATDPATMEAEALEREGNALLAEIIRRPRACVCVFGGAAGLHDLLVPSLRSLIREGVVAAALRVGAMMLDGGTKSGVMEMVGSAFERVKTGIRLLGVCPRGLVQLPGTPADSSLSPLEDHHSGFIFPPSDDWGGETTTMFTVAAAIHQRLPVVAVLANGGMISKNEIWNAVKLNVPVIVIEGSGRLADKVARDVRRRREMGDEWTDSEVDDPQVADIVRDGRIHLAPVVSSHQTMNELIVKLLEEERARKGGAP